MHRRLRRTMALGIGAAFLVAIPVAIAWPSLAAQTTNRAPRTVSVASLPALSTALSAAVPGDHIVVADGVYNSGTVKVTRSGTAAAPITVSAADTGRTTFAGSAKVQLGTVSHVVVQGFVFGSSAGVTVPVGATDDRITRNTFQGSHTGAYLSVAGDRTEVDHNLFRNKTTAGVYLQVSGPGAHGMAKNVHIHHNYFYNHQFKGANGGESIRLGLSGKQHADAHALVEYNLFEKADGDSEAISVKSSDNVVRYNTIRDSRGTLSLRHGWGTTVDGNFIIGGSSGIRFFGNNHTIINNVVEGTTGQPLEVGGGELKDDTNSGTDHEAADHCVVAYNTIQGSGSAVVKFGDKPVWASDITLADNILIGKGQLVRTGRATQLTFEGNIVSGGSAGVPGNGFRTADPKLVDGTGGLLRLSAASPAVGAGIGPFAQVTQDMDGQARAGAKDVGADQLNGSGPQHRPLTAADVGPQAP